MTTLTFAMLLLTGQGRSDLFNAAFVSSQLAAHDASTSGVLGFCVIADGRVAGVNVDRPFSMQSVMKLVVSLAVLDQVDKGKIKLNQVYTLYPSDLSVSHQPIAEHITAKGYKASVKELIERSVQESDSCAVDFLIRKIGGVITVQKFLKSTGIKGIRIDRDERSLQSENAGITWRSAYTDPQKFEAARAAVSERKKDLAWRKYLSDPRDTSTPQAMAQLLSMLIEGTLLSKSSTAYAYDVMKGCVTYPDRLKEGVPKGWQFGHKTGSSHTYKGVAGVTNDVGIAVSPSGSKVVLAAFLARSNQDMKGRNAVIRKGAKTVFESLHP